MALLDALTIERVTTLLTEECILRLGLFVLTRKVPPDTECKIVSLESHTDVKYIFL